MTARIRQTIGDTSEAKGSCRACCNSIVWALYMCTCMAGLGEVCSHVAAILYCPQRFSMLLIQKFLILFFFFHTNTVSPVRQPLQQSSSSCCCSKLNCNHTDTSSKAIRSSHSLTPSNKELNKLYKELSQCGKLGSQSSITVTPFQRTNPLSSP